jgi:phosphoribosylanthranilate isomerase
VLADPIQQVLKRAAYYDPFVDYVLFDPSGGKGKLFDANQACAYIEGLEAYMPTTRIGIAGGLQAKTIDALQPLLETAQRPFSIDAQRLLQTPIKKHLDYDACRMYIEKAAVLLDQARR